MRQLACSKDIGETALKGDAETNWKAHELINYSCGVLASIVGGILGLGGGFILDPLFLELGISLRCVVCLFHHRC